MIIYNSKILLSSIGVISVKRMICLLCCLGLMQIWSVPVWGEGECSHSNQTNESKPATCTSAGYMREICEDCREVLSEEVFPAAGHQLGDWYVITEPTCETPGEKAADCICGQVLAQIPPTGHSYGAWVTISTEGNREVQESVCKNCGDVRERTVEKDESKPSEPEEKPDFSPDPDPEPVSDPEGWTHRGDKTYYYLSGRKYATGWLDLENWYYFNEEGIMQTGWQQIDGQTYYLGEDGIMKTGWLQDEGRWYWLSESGAMRKGWQQIGNGNWYYFDGAGVMQTGWFQDAQGKWYWLSDTGAMKTGWHQTAPGRWYYFGSSGEMQTGWLYQGDSWYYLGSDGVMQTGWVKSDRGYWYYMEPSGRMKTGWLWTADGWYCLSLLDGHMLTSCYAPDGHWINEQGLWQP